MIDVQTSAVSGVSDPVVGQAITAAATRALNSELTEQYVKSIYVGFNDTQKQFTKVADAAGQLDDGTRKLADGLGQTSTGTKQLSDGLNQLDAGGAPLASGAKKYADGVGQFADGIGTLADSTSALPKGGRQIADGVAGIETGLKTYQKALRTQADEAGSAKAPTPPSQADFEAAVTKQGTARARPADHVRRHQRAAGRRPAQRRAVRCRPGVGRGDRRWCLPGRAATASRRPARSSARSSRRRPARTPGRRVRPRRSTARPTG